METNSINWKDLMKNKNIKKIEDDLNKKIARWIITQELAWK